MLPECIPAKETTAIEFSIAGFKSVAKKRIEEWAKKCYIANGNPK
jgi:hypothetical protein